MSDLTIAALIVGFIAGASIDVLFLRWLRRRPNRKYELSPTPDTPPCWPYGWPDE